MARPAGGYREITMNEKNAIANVTETGKPSGNNAAKGSSRRKFLGQVGAALAGGAGFGQVGGGSPPGYKRGGGGHNRRLMAVVVLWGGQALVPAPAPRPRD